MAQPNNIHAEAIRIIEAITAGELTRAELQNVRADARAVLEATEKALRATAAEPRTCDACGHVHAPGGRHGYPGIPCADRACCRAGQLRCH